MPKRITYKSSGVNIDTTNQMVERIKLLCKQTHRKEVLGRIGNFSGFFKIPQRKMKDPVLVASTDGVGTKLMIAKTREMYSSVGIDLVAMCVNDIITAGAEPLFFLDYYATGKVKPAQFYSILGGIVKGCKLAHCALIGGEIAEMPRYYEKGKYDLAGFCVGIVDREKIVDGSCVAAGDVVIGLASSGLHSNGYSLARKLFSKKEIRSTRWGSILLRPTEIYVRPILNVINSVKIKSIAHITGGGFYDNIPRVITKKTSVIVNKKAWQIPPIFQEMQKRGHIKEQEMFRTFNMGIGMVLVVNKKDVKRVTTILKRSHVKSWVVGNVIKGSNTVIIK